MEFNVLMTISVVHKSVPSMAFACPKVVTSKIYQVNIINVMGKCVYKIQIVIVDNVLCILISIIRSVASFVVKMNFLVKTLKKSCFIDSVMETPAHNI
jgi:hypothetical protein